MSLSFIFCKKSLNGTTQLKTPTNLSHIEDPDEGRIILQTPFLLPTGRHRDQFIVATGIPHATSECQLEYLLESRVCGTQDLSRRIKHPTT